MPSVRGSERRNSREQDLRVERGRSERGQSAGQGASPRADSGSSDKVTISNRSNAAAKSKGGSTSEALRDAARPKEQEQKLSEPPPSQRVVAPENEAIKPDNETTESIARDIQVQDRPLRETVASARTDRAQVKALEPSPEERDEARAAEKRDQRRESSLREREDQQENRRSENSARASVQRRAIDQAV